MGNFRFYRRTRLFPGLSVNWSASGPSLSLGVRGAHVTLGHGRVTRTVGIPGSGLYWTSRSGHSTGFHSAHVETPVSDGAQTAAHVSATAVVLGILLAPVAIVLAIVAFRFVLGLAVAIVLFSAVGHGGRRR